LNYILTLLTKSGIPKKDLDYHLIRATMVVLSLFVGYDRFPYSGVRLTAILCGYLIVGIAAFSAAKIYFGIVGSLPKSKAEL
jgi:hypothetical protein